LDASLPLIPVQSTVRQAKPTLLLLDLQSSLDFGDLRGIFNQRRRAGWLGKSAPSELSEYFERGRNLAKKRLSPGSETLTIRTSKGELTLRFDPETREVAIYREKKSALVDYFVVNSPEAFDALLHYSPELEKFRSRFLKP